jgi:hypothetical protein
MRQHLAPICSEYGYESSAILHGQHYGVTLTWTRDASQSFREYQRKRLTDHRYNLRIATGDSIKLLPTITFMSP